MQLPNVLSSLKIFYSDLSFIYSYLYISYINIEKCSLVGSFTAEFLVSDLDNREFTNLLIVSYIYLVVGK